MSRRAAVQHRPACREWQGSGFQFLPLDEHGAAIWPPGYVPQAAAGARSNARVLADARAHEHAERQRREAKGWAGNTFDLANTPHNQAAPGRLQPEYAVLQSSVIWRVLELIRHHGRPITVAEMADAIDRPARSARACIQPWLVRGVLSLIDGSPTRSSNGLPARDVTLGTRSHMVRLRSRA